MSERSKAEPSAEIFGRYLLGPRLGSGGMGIVHAATWIGPEGVARQVCVKRVRAGAAAQAARVRLFVNEARLSLSLSHGNVVQTLDFGRVGDEYFLALELVDGTDLGTVLAAERTAGAGVPPEVAAHVAEAVAAGLAHAHAKGVVHRDVKPGNVLLSRSGEVKIADFGVAALVGDRALRGTAGYMAPEQAAGEPADERSDLFAVGLILHEMLTGHAAYGGGDEAAVLARAREARIEPLAAAVPADLVDVVRRLTERDPARRLQTASELADRLGAFVAGARAAGAAPPTRWIATRAATLARPAQEAPAPSTDGQTDDRPATYFTRDGSRQDFEAQIALPTRLEIPRRPRRRAWLALAAIPVAAMLWVLSRPATEPVSRPVRTEEPRAPAPAKTPVRTPQITADRAPPPPAPSTARPVHAIRHVAATAAPEPRGTATLDLQALPYAQVYVDGINKGETPLTGISVRAGEHHVRFVHASSRREWTTRITLADGERRTVRAELRDAPAAAADAAPPR